MIGFLEIAQFLFLVFLITVPWSYSHLIKIWSILSFVFYLFFYCIKVHFLDKRGIIRMSKGGDNRVNQKESRNIK